MEIIILVILLLSGLYLDSCIYKKIKKLIDKENENRRIENKKRPMDLSEDLLKASINEKMDRMNEKQLRFLYKMIDV